MGQILTEMVLGVVQGGNNRAAWSQAPAEQGVDNSVTHTPADTKPPGSIRSGWFPLRAFLGKDRQTEKHDRRHSQSNPNFACDFGDQR